MGQYVHYVPGGGLGDLVRELYRNGALGVLKHWKYEHPRDELRVVIMSHNPASRDLLVGQDWIDEIVDVPFDIVADPSWTSLYSRRPDLFEDRTELRFLLPVNRSLYAQDTRIAGKDRIRRIAPVSMATDIVLSRHEREIAEFHRDFLVLHPFGGHVAKWFPPELATRIHETLGPRSVTVAADYARPGHPEEVALASATGLRPRAFSARVLVEVVRTARAVVAAESSAYYIAAMWGRPVAMLWSELSEYRRVLEGTSNWNFYYGDQDERNLFLPLPPLMTEAETARLLDWIAQAGR